MQYILSEKEYKELKEKGDRLDKVTEYISNSISEEPKYVNIYGRNGEIIPYFDSITTEFNLDLEELFKLLGFKLNGSFTMNFNKY